MVNNGGPVVRSRMMTAIDIVTHLIVTVILAGVFYRFTGKWTWAVLTIVGGVLIDLDHFLDYFLYYGLKLNLRDFFDHKYLASGKCYILFHSWEVLAVVWCLSVIVRWMVPVAAGMTSHILIDYFFSHRGHPKFLSLIYRWRNGFDLSCLSRPCDK
ncbi:MAG: hypothetical protein WBD00_04345 [Candidatus Omnitrophota bacterium]